MRKNTFLRILMRLTENILGKRRLEVCGHGPGSPLPLDFHTGCAGGHGWNNPAGAHSLRRQSANRREVLRVCHNSRSLPSTIRNTKGESTLPYLREIFSYHRRICTTYSACLINGDWLLTNFIRASKMVSNYRFCLIHIVHYVEESCTRSE